MDTPAKTMLIAIGLMFGGYVAAWAATAVTNSTGTSTPGNAACFDVTTGTSIKDCNVQPNTSVTGSGSVALQDSPIFTTTTEIQDATNTPINNMYYSAVPSVDYVISQYNANAKNSALVEKQFGEIQTLAHVVTSGAEQGRMYFNTINAGTIQTELALGGGLGVGGAVQRGYGTVSASSNYWEGASQGVSCSGPPTASFATCGGIVCHC